MEIAKRAHLLHFKRHPFNGTRNYRLDIIPGKRSGGNPCHRFIVIPVCGSPVSDGIIMDITVEQLVGQIILVPGNFPSFCQRGKAFFRIQNKFSLKKACIILNSPLTFLGIFKSKRIYNVITDSITICNVKLKAGIFDGNFAYSLLRGRKGDRCTVVIPSD